MIDIHEDRKQAEKWKEKNPEEAVMTSTQLATLAIRGIATCEDYCGSRERLGEDACFCIRAHLPSRDHYFLYLELRRLAKELASFALTAEIAKKTANH